MSKIISVLVIILFILTLAFSYKARNYRFSFVKTLHDVVSGEKITKPEKKLEIIEEKGN